MATHRLHIVIEVLLAILLPPLGVCLRTGCCSSSRPITVLKIKGLPPFAKRKDGGSLSKDKERAAKKPKTDKVQSGGDKKKEGEREKKKEKREEKKKKSGSEGRSKSIHDRPQKQSASADSIKPLGGDDIPMAIPLSDVKGKSSEEEPKTVEEVEALVGSGFPVNHRTRLRNFLVTAMPKFPMEKVFDQTASDDKEEPEEDEYLTIPAQSSKYSGEELADMLKEWMKCIPAGYPQSLKGFEEGHVGPVKAELANALIRLDGVSKDMARNRAENKQYLKLARSCDDYLTAEIQQQEMRHQNAMNAIQDSLTKANDAAFKATQRANELLVEKDHWEKEKKEMVEAHKKEINDLKGQLETANNSVEKWKKHTEEAASSAEEAYKAIVNEAWDHVSGGTPFSYLETFINWVIERDAAERDKRTPPPKPEIEVEEDKAEEDVDSNGSDSDDESSDDEGDDVEKDDDAPDE